MKCFVTYQFRVYLILVFSVSILSNTKSQVLRNYSTISNDWEVRDKLTDDEKFQLGNKIGEFFNYYEWNYGSIDPVETVVPIVFHILYKDEENRIPREKIIEQVKLLNDYFGNKIRGPEDDPYLDNAVDTKITFCIGDIENPNIQFKQVGTEFESNKFNIYDEKEGFQNINPDSVLNIWVVDLPEDNAGWAQFPFRPGKTDGIVINSYYLKNKDEKYNSSKTLVHLIGSYLGLEDIWGEGGCTDDDVPDTPIHDGPNWDCYPQVHISACGGLTPEMLGNFMDNTPDKCAWMFTEGQSKRMALTLRKYRSGLIYNECNTKVRLTTTSSEDLSFTKDDITIFPNPTMNQIEIRSNKIIKEVKIIDNNGKTMKSLSKLNKENFTINIEDLNSNYYFIQFISEKNFEVKKVIKI